MFVVLSLAEILWQLSATNNKTFDSHNLLPVSAQHWPKKRFLRIFVTIGETAAVALRTAQIFRRTEGRDLWWHEPKWSCKITRHALNTCFSCLQDISFDGATYSAGKQQVCSGARHYRIKSDFRGKMWAAKHIHGVFEICHPIERCSWSNETTRSTNNCFSTACYAYHNSNPDQAS